MKDKERIRSIITTKRALKQIILKAKGYKDQWRIYKHI